MQKTPDSHALRQQKLCEFFLIARPIVDELYRAWMLEHHGGGQQQQDFTEYRSNYEQQIARLWQDYFGTPLYQTATIDNGRAGAARFAQPPPVAAPQVAAPPPQMQPPPGVPQ